MIAEACCKPCTEAAFPDAFVVHLQGGCCRCAEAVKSSACGSCDDSGDCQNCSWFNQSVVVRRTSPDSLVYEHQFRPGDFVSGRIPCSVEKATFELIKHQKNGQVWYSGCFALKFSEVYGLRTATWYRSRIVDCCNIGWLRRHIPGGTCCWPQVIEVSTVPTPDFVPPPPEWTRGHPDDLNDADYWPSLDVPLMQDSPEVSVRYFNGELQLRVKDVGSDGFGVPWGHTRIYSNRLSNSYDWGNGTNWLVHEWPQLLRRKTDPAEVRRFHPLAGGNAIPTGCTLVMLRGTRNTTWFDEFRLSDDTTQWRPRFGAKQTLEYNSIKKCFRVITPHGHKWEFYPFSRPCFTPKRPQDIAHDPRLDGKLIRHVNPGGKSIVATYKEGKLDKFERSANGTTESFSYEYIKKGDNKGRLQYVIWKRGKPLERVEYKYYGKGEPCGNLGDLKTATTAYRVNGDWKSREDYVHYYRYHKKAHDTYCQGMLKYVVGPEAFQRIRKFVNGDPLQAEDAIVQRFADVEIFYNTENDTFLARRVEDIALFGGSRRHFFKYTQKKSETRITLPPDSPSYDKWHSTTVETRADGTTKEITTNFIGQTLRHDLIDGSDRWVHAWEYHQNHTGLVLALTPTTVSNPKKDDETSQPSFHERSGKVYRLSYLPVGGGRQAYLQAVAVNEGKGESSPTASDGDKRIKSYEYQSVNSTYNIYALKKETAHGIAVGSDGKTTDVKTTDGTTEFNTVFQFEDRNQDLEDGLAWLEGRVTGLPIVDSTHFPRAKRFLPTGQDRYIGQLFDEYGNIKVTVDQRSTYKYLEIDVAKGVPIREITKFKDRDGNDQELLTSYSSDDFGRITQILGPPHMACLKAGQEDTRVRTATWHTYKVFSGEVWTAQGYVSGAAPYCINPVKITKTDLFGRVTDEIVAVRQAPGRPDPSETLSQEKWVRWTHQEYDEKHSKIVCRVYHQIPQKGDGTPGINYTETTTTSNIASRQKSVDTEGGTHYKVEFNSRGLPTEVYTGSSPDSLIRIAEASYDNKQPGGNGNLTSLKRADGHGNDRFTFFEYDFRDRQSRVIEADKSQVDYTYNRHNTVYKIRRSYDPDVAMKSQPIETRSKTAGQEAPSRPKGVLAEQTQLIDARGRIHTKQVNGVLNKDVSTFLEPLQEKYLYDEANQLVAVQPHGGWYFGVPFNPIHAVRYDGLGRETTRRVVVVNDVVSAFRQIETYYNEVGDAVLTTTLERDYIVSQPGEWLGDANGSDGKGKTGLVPSRVSSVGSWFDPLGRVVATSTFGIDVFGASRPRQTQPLIYPTTIQEYNDRGELVNSIDPLNHNVRSEFDHAGRRTATAANLDAVEFKNLIAPRGSPESLFNIKDDATLSRFAYSPESALTRTTTYNSSTGIQVSQVLYGGGAEGESDADRVPSAQLPREIVDAEGRRIKISYNELGEIDQKIDPNGTIHDYIYDDAGRISRDTITCDGTKVDNRIKSIAYGYDEFGRLEVVQSLDAAGNKINSVVRRSGTFNEITAEAQLHLQDEIAAGSKPIHDLEMFDGRLESANLSSLGFMGVVGYYYRYPDRTHNVHQHCATWYPGNPGSKGLWISNHFTPEDLALGRVNRVAENELASADARRVLGTARFEYFGANLPYSESIGRQTGVAVVTDLSQGGQGGYHIYGALDNLNRQRFCTWKKKVKAKTSAILDDTELGLDLNDNVLWRSAKLKSNRSHVRTYDRLDRIKTEDHGTLIEDDKLGPLILPPGKYRQSWRKDSRGNWRTWRKSFLDGTSVVQGRKHTLTNDIFEFQSTPAWPKPVCDSAGNMTAFPSPTNPSQSCRAKYDAWGRLVKFTDGVGLETSFEYDGLGRRILQRLPDESERHFYYDQAGRVLSEMIQLPGEKRILDRQYVWDPNSPQKLICRLRQIPGQAEPERLYALHDTAGNVVALVNDAGDVQERFVYDAQGHVTVLAPDYSERAESLWEWEYLIAGMRYDRITGFHFLGASYYHSQMGRSLPCGAISVLSESVVNAYGLDFAFSSWRPPGISGMQSAERFMKWVHEQPAWLKFTVGAAALTITVGVVILTSLHNPYGIVMGIGAACGALQGGIGSALAGGDYGDVMLSAGLGAAFGAVAPWGGIGGLTGSVVGVTAAAIARGQGEDWVTLSMGWEWGGLIGGVAGDIRQGALTAAKAGLSRPMLRGIMHAGPDLLGGGAGAMIGYGLGGDLNSAFHGATMGMMVGSLTGATARGVWGTRRFDSVCHSRAWNAVDIQALQIDVSGRLVPSSEAYGLIGWWRNFKVKRAARLMGYDPRLVRYVNEIGAFGPRLPRGGVRNIRTGEILIERAAFESGFLAEQGILNYRAILAHEIGHRFGIPVSRTIIAPGQMTTTMFPADPEEFWASFFGATRVPNLTRGETLSLLEHAYSRYR